MAGKHATMAAVLLVCMAADERDGECILSLLSTLIALLASGDGKCPPGVPPHDGLRTASDSASGRTDGAHRSVATVGRPLNENFTLPRSL